MKIGIRVHYIFVGRAIFVRNIKKMRLLDKVQIKFIQTSKSSNARGFTMFVRQSYKTLLTFCYKFQILILTLYPYSSTNLLKVSIKSTKFILGS